MPARLTSFPILLVDDDATSETLIRLSIDRQKLAVVLMSVGSGKQALDYLSGEGPYRDRKNYPLPKLLLLDAKLPGTSGVELIHSIRNELRLSRAPIVVFSASQWEKDINQAYDAGAASYIIKPSSMDRLDKIVSTLVDYWSRTETAPAP